MNSILIVHQIIEIVIFKKDSHVINTCLHANLDVEWMFILEKTVS